MSSPYYRFGYQGPSYAFRWNAGPSGTKPSIKSGVRTELGNDPFVESMVPNDLHFPALADWPAVRPAGPEPLDPGEAPVGVFGTLSTNEQRMVWLAMGLAAGWVVYRLK